MRSRRPLSRRPLSRVVVLSGVLASLASSLLLPLSASAAGEKTTICHRTSSHTNPYRRITVAQSAVINANGHRGHDGPLWVAGGPRGWGDVIPGAEVGADPSYQKNWPEGRTVWDGTLKVGRRSACGYLSAAAFVTAERALGVLPADIVDDLNEQKANEDVALLAALGLRQFTLASLDRLDAVSATTAPVAAGDLTTTTAVLRGTVSSGASTSAVRSFVWGPGTELVDGATVPADQGSGSGTAAITATLRGLRPGTTYSFKAVGTTGVGTELEGVLEGEVVTFTTPLEDAPVAKRPQSITLPPLADLVVGTRTALPIATADSRLEVHTASVTPLVCQLDGGEVVPVAAGTCRITADQPGDGTWEPATQAAWAVQVTDPTPPTRTRRPQAITFDDPAPRSWRAPAFRVDPTSDARLPVELSSLTTDVCTTDGLQVTVRDVGECRLAADQAGDDEVLPATRAVARFAVTKAPQAVVFGAPEQTSHPVGSVVLGATATSGLDVVLTADPAAAAVCAVDGSSLVLRSAGTCAVTAGQAGDARWEAAEPVVRTFTATRPLPPVPPTPPAPPAPPAPPTPPTPTPSPEAPVVPVPPVQRVEGRERTETSARLAVSMYPEPRTARVVVLARSDVYADGLTGSPLAGTLDGPVLLTAPDRLPAATAAAIRAVLATDGTVVVLGGPRAVTPEVVEQVEDLGYRSERIGGVDRYATATLIADRIDETTNVSRVYLATGVNFPDALAAANAAEVTGGAVLLTRGATMPDVTSSWLAEHGSERRTAVGGAAAAAAPQAERIVGRDRYTTAAMVAEAVLPEADGVVLVTGTDFPDGLAGASYAARNDWPMLLVDPRATALTPAQDAYLGRLSGGVKDLVAIGGSTALPPAATSLVSRRLDRVAAR